MPTGREITARFERYRREAQSEGGQVNTESTASGVTSIAVLVAAAVALLVSMKKSGDFSLAQAIGNTASVESQFTPDDDGDATLPATDPACADLTEAAQARCIIDHGAFDSDE